MELRHVPKWEELPWLFAGFSGRQGGVSRLFAGDAENGLLNLGFTPEDDPEAVEENRRRLVRAAGGGGWQLVVAKQVHGTEVREVTETNQTEAMELGRGRWEADGLVSRAAGILLGVGAADCVPLLVADVRQRVVGAFHAGWRGTAAGMAEAGLRMMAVRFGTRPEDCLAAIGPSIGPCCYEVGEAVRSAISEETWLGQGMGEGRWMLDLWTANREQLVRAGVRPEAVTVLGECTFCSRDAQGRRRYFSYRAEGGVTGRMLGVIGVRKDGGCGSAEHDGGAQLDRAPSW